MRFVNPVRGGSGGTPGGATLGRRGGLGGGAVAVLIFKRDAGNQRRRRVSGYPGLRKVLAAGDAERNEAGGKRVGGEL
jgi:hypothetical protein